MSDKVTVPDGRLWYQEVAAGAYDIGLTDDVLSQVKDQCWAIIPNVGNVKQGQPLFAIETNDELLSILSPFTGRVVGVEFVAQNSPEKLTAGQRIISFDTNTRPRVVPPPPAAEVAGPRPRRAFEGAINVDAPPPQQLFDPREVIEHMRRQNAERRAQQQQAAGQFVVLDELPPDHDPDADIAGQPGGDGAW